MDGWLVAVLVVLVIAAVLLAILVGFAVRRRWLARDGGTFECSIQLRSSSPDTGWVLGLARYNEEEFEWFRFFSYSARPRKSFRRSRIRVVESREPDPVEAVSLYAGQQVVTLEEREADEVRSWSLAMGRESLTGMMSWLEAAPPQAAGF